MSMLSSQIDKLRELAADADVYGDTRHFRDPLSDAADTIWELRDALQQANAENAKLIVKLNAEHIVRQNVEAENAKLRELVGDIWEFGFSNSAGANSVKEWYRVRDELEQRVYAALGVEVDG